MRRVGAPDGGEQSSVMKEATYTIKQTVFTKEEMKGMRVIYVTDVEGNYDYFESLIKRSKGLFRDSSGQLDMMPDCHFVFGGDVCDRGRGDLRIANDIVNLCKKYPSRVHIILGNRDINKIRLRSELLPKYLKSKLEVFWIDENDINEPKIDDDMPPFSPARRLHTILECTMGAPEAFQHRLNELSDMGIISDGMSEDEKDGLVVESFVSSIGDGGCMLEFLRLGCLALQLGDVFFFHGGIHEGALGWVPPNRHSEEGQRERSVQEWCHSLASFHHSEMLHILECSEGDWEKFSTCGGYGHSEPGSRLLQYGMGVLPDGTGNPTICYDNFLNNGAPDPPSDGVVSFLNKSGIRLTVTGHQPHGDAPLVISMPTLQLVTGDTSYAQNVEWDNAHFSDNLALLDNFVDKKGAAGIKSAGTRGYAVAEILIIFDCDTTVETFSKVVIHGVTQNLMSYECSADDGHIGRRTGDGWWVKLALRLPGDSVSTAYMVSKSEGRSVVNAVICEDGLKKLLC